MGLALGLVALLAGGVLILPRLTAHPFSRAATQAERIHAEMNRVAVVDGETLRVGPTVVRLYGIVAPTRGTVCAGAGRERRDCGAAAANALADFVRNRPIGCDLLGRASTATPMARCDASGADLAAEMVASGWARATGEAKELTAAEASARAARRGIWAGGAAD